VTAYRPLYRPSPRTRHCVSVTVHPSLRAACATALRCVAQTWEGIQAAKQLESQGVTTQVYLVFSMIQAAAAAQAGVSVIQPNVGRLREWCVCAWGKGKGRVVPRVVRVRAGKGQE